MKKFLFILSIFIANFGFSQSDCISALPVCGNSNISYNPQNAGNIAEQTSASCLALEHYSVWYTFSIATSGTLEFTIAPDVNSDDYDFALYGPNINCATHDFGNAIRCNFSGADGPTGIGTPPAGASAGAWDTALNVTAGQVYYLLIDNYVPQNGLNGFNLSWGGTAALTSPFNTTIQPNPFIAPGVNQSGQILICTDPQMFDFSTLSSGILNGNANFSISYYMNSNNALTGTSPITTPINVNTTNIYYYAISYTDPTNPNNPANVCKEYGEITFQSGAIVVNDQTVMGCNNNNTGIGVFDITTATPNVYNDPTAVVQYYPTVADANAGTNEITTNLTNYVTTPKQIFAKVTTTQGCTNIATITLSLLPLLPVNDVTINACNNNNFGIGSFNLTLANVYPTDPAAPKKYFPTVNDLLNNTNEITNPTIYSSAEGQVYVEVTGAQGCKNYAAINLAFYPVVVTQNATISSCFIEGNPNTAEFDLGSAVVSTQFGTTNTYYPSLQDAINQNNQIQNPNGYVSTSTSIYVRVTDSNLCWGTAKINLEVIPPVYSNVLKDKIICIEDTTTLDAGSGFESYLWSTGATTQSITNVSVGEYWVILTTEGCPTLQKVKVIKSPSPVITNIEITNNSATVAVSGGTQPYQYSLDGTTWQDSNIFNELPRGQNFVYVKDSYDCDPIMVEITVPNLVNAITPNSDGVNDYVDYTALSYKKDLILNVYDRYGNKMFQADKSNGYKWDGRSSGKKVTTGTYWYSITWVEPNTNVPVKYTGWVLVKNRE